MICEKWELGTGKLELVTRERQNEETRKKGKKGKRKKRNEEKREKGKKEMVN